jgi:hypothetical protein
VIEEALIEETLIEETVIEEALPHWGLSRQKTKKQL